MYFVGIDISKYKHDCFIATEVGEVIKEPFSFSNTNEGFLQLLTILKSLDSSKEKIRIGFEATGHYHMNLMLFLERNNYSFMELNAALVKKIIEGKTLRKTKTDKKDAYQITMYLMSVEYKPHPKQFYHKFALKSLCRLRSKLVKQRSFYEMTLTNILDMTFPEFKPFFNGFSATSLYILNKYKTPERIANMKDFDTLRKCSKGKFSYAKFLKLKELAKNTVGVSNDILSIELETTLSLRKNIDKEINNLEDKIANYIKELNPPTLSIPGIGVIFCANIISEYGDMSRFKSADACVAFAGIEPSISQSGTENHDGKMVKHGSGNLRFYLLNAADYIVMHIPEFTEYYYKKRNEGKTHRVALSHVAKKLVRLIYKLETENIMFDSTKLK